MLKKKKPVSGAERRKKERRKPGDQRFPGRLVDKVYAAPPRKGDRRAGDRRED